MSDISNSRFAFIDATPGETVQSWIARMYHRGSFTINTVVRDIFGNAAWRGLLNPALPTNLKSIAAHCPPGHWFNSASQIVMNNTAVPYFIYFKDEKRRGELCSLVECSDGRKSYHAAFGTATYPIRATPDQPQFCLECIDEEWDKVGFPIFHVEHQLPGVALCWRHKTVLWKGCNQCGRRHSQSAPVHLPGQCAYGHIRAHEQAFPNIPGERSALEWIAIESAYMWRSQFRFPENPLSILRRAACDRFASGNGYDVGKLRERLISRFGSVLEWLESPVTRENKWYRKALSSNDKESRQPSALRCLLLVGAIFESVKDFETYARKETEGLDVHEDNADSTKEWAQNLPAVLSKNSFRLNRVQRLLGVSFTEIKQEMLNQKIDLPKSGIAFNRIPPSVYSAVLRDLRAGGDKLHVARSRKLSLYQMELIVLWEPGLQDEWEAAWLKQSLDSAKSTVLNYRGNPAQRSRSEIWSKHPGCMETIWKRDPDWIEANLLERPRGRSDRTKQWSRREYDHQVSEKMVKIAKAELAGGRPRLLSVTRLVKESGQWQRYEKYREDLPLVQETLHLLVESKEQFHLRRLIWAGRQLVLRCKPIHLQSLRMTSGLDGRVVKQHFDNVVKHPGVHAPVPYASPHNSVSI